MKLRIKGNSLRLRISRSEMASLLATGVIQNSIHFGIAAEAKLTYSLQHTAMDEAIRIEYHPQQVTVVISTAAAQRWGGSDEVGIYGTAKVANGQLELVVEKDFACLDIADDDAFPNPNAEAAC